MCDTLVALGNKTAAGVTLFAKNSDREPNEAHHVLSIPAASHPDGTDVACTRLSIPQVTHTHAVLLAKPFWMWGAEMGVNQHGVAIGNEAVFTRLPAQEQPALLGMDLLRLGLERAATAAEAVDVITTLIARHGQGGDGGFTVPFHYDNSFLLADPREAWVLETAGRHWAAKLVSGSYAISNGLTLTDAWDLASPDLVDHAVSRGWCASPSAFDFAACYSDPQRSAASACTARRRRATERLSRADGGLTVWDAIDVLRDHGTEGPGPSPNGPAAKTVCMHAGGGPNQMSQTTGSLVASLHPDGPVCFVTGTAAPCTGVFKPVWPDVPVPGQELVPTGTFDAATLFWRHERLHRATLMDERDFVGLYRSERDALERSFVTDAIHARRQDVSSHAALSARCFDEAASASARWEATVAAATEPGRASGPEQARVPDHAYRAAWLRVNRAARFPASPRR